MQYQPVENNSASTVFENPYSEGGPSNTGSSMMTFEIEDDNEADSSTGTSAGIASNNNHNTINRIRATVDRMTSNSPGRRFLAKLFPSYVSSTSSHLRSGQVFGNGLQNDGVFSNMTAKPRVNAEDENYDTPPTYEEAAADQAPPYWEFPVFSPYGEGAYVDGLPVGFIVIFVWNMLVSSIFQFVGFLLTYLLHTSHAAKEGSRAGLGITFMSHGYYMIPSGQFLAAFGSKKTTSDVKFEPVDPNNFDVEASNELNGQLDTYHSNLNGKTDTEETEYFDENSAPIVAYGLIALGVFILIKSIIDYHRAIQMERTIMQSPNVDVDVDVEQDTHQNDTEEV